MKILKFVVLFFCLLTMQSFANNLTLGVDYIILDKPLKKFPFVISLINLHLFYFLIVSF